MAMNCTRCDGTGFLTTHQLPDDVVEDFQSTGRHQIVLDWTKDNVGHDVSVCDCCGDGDAWYGTPGEHYNSDDRPGRDGPYGYNGGLCECN